MSEASGTPASKSTTIKLAVLVALCIAAGLGFFLMSRGDDDATGKESKAAARAQEMAEQSKHDAPPPPVKEIVATPEAPPTRGPMKSPKP